MGYVRPGSVAEALRHLAAEPACRLVAGCTDFYPTQGLRPVAEPIVDLSGLSEARGITVEAATTRIGALTTWTDVARATLPPAFRALQQAARQIGAIQVQNVATIGGNLCNASPAADGVPPLLALDAQVELSSAAGIRRLPLDEFILGNRKTARRPDEMLTAIEVPHPQGATVSTFLKLGSRSYLVISIVMVAVLLETDGQGRVAKAAVAVGACSPVARRLRELEADLIGQPLEPTLAERVTMVHLSPLSPIDDVRATAEYRREAALTLIRRGIAEIAQGGPS